MQLHLVWSPSPVSPRASASSAGVSRHFKDVSLPGTVHLSVSFKEPGRPAFVPTGVYDAIDQAAIADGACRMLPDASYSGYTYWHYPERVRRVLEALEAAPSTQGPSVFTLSTNATLTR